MTIGLVEAYLEALERADLKAVLRLFADGAVVHSPLYGELTAQASTLRCSSTPPHLDYDIARP